MRYEIIHPGNRVCDKARIVSVTELRWISIETQHGYYPI
jgi:hypothetical protein